MAKPEPEARVFCIFLGIFGGDSKPQGILYFVFFIFLYILPHYLVRNLRPLPFLLFNKIKKVRKGSGVLLKRGGIVNPKIRRKLGYFLVSSFCKFGASNPQYTRVYFLSSTPLPGAKLTPTPFFTF